MKRPVSLLLSTVAALAITTVPAHAADGHIEVEKDKDCVWVVEQGGEVSARYVRTRFVVTHFDEAGEQVGEPEATAWKRFYRRDHLEKWRRICGPGSPIR